MGHGKTRWYIECSAMSKKHLGETIDIHAGGQDLQFPHHRKRNCSVGMCERRAVCPLLMHNGYITIDNEKMSKSKGNFFTVRDILKDYSGEVIRFFCFPTVPQPDQFQQGTDGSGQEQPGEDGKLQGKSGLSGFRWKRRIGYRGGEKLRWTVTISTGRPLSAPWTTI